jgi:dihydrofolate reductase
MTDKRVVMVAAVADNGVIGRGGDIPWSNSEDLKHFRGVTKGNTVVMGRRTFESIGHPLPYRTNVVVTRQSDWSREGVFVASDVEASIALGQEFDGDIMIIGGGQIYTEAMHLADQQVLTEIHESPEGDTYYPPYDETEWAETKRETYDGYDFVWLERIFLG